MKPSLQNREEHLLCLVPVEEYLLPGQPDDLISHRDEIEIPPAILVISRRIIVELTAVAFDDKAAANQQVHPATLPREPRLRSHSDASGFQPPPHRRLRP